MTTLIALFCCFENEKKSCVLCRNFISIYTWPLGERTSERYFQHEKVKFVSPRGHVISSICTITLYLYISAIDMVRRDGGDIMNEIKNWSVHGYDMYLVEHFR